MTTVSLPDSSYSGGGIISLGQKMCAISQCIHDLGLRQWQLSFGFHEFRQHQWKHM